MFRGTFPLLNISNYYRWYWTFTKFTFIPKLFMHSLNLHILYYTFTACVNVCALHSLTNHCYLFIVPWPHSLCICLFYTFTDYICRRWIHWLYIFDAIYQLTVYILCYASQFGRVLIYTSTDPLTFLYFFYVVLFILWL